MHALTHSLPDVRSLPASCLQVSNWFGAPYAVYFDGSLDGGSDVLRSCATLVPSGTVYGNNAWSIEALIFTDGDGEIDNNQHILFTWAKRNPDSPETAKAAQVGVGAGPGGGGDMWNTPLAFTNTAGTDYETVRIKNGGTPTDGYRCVCYAGLLSVDR